MSTILARGQGVMTVSVALAVGIDGQGATLYDSPFSVDARVVHTTEMVQLTDGTQVRTTVTLWVDVAQTPIVEQAQVTIIEDGVSKTYIAVEVDQLKRLNGEIDHLRVRMREQKN